MRRMYSDTFLIGRVWFTVDQIGKRDYRISVGKFRITLYKVKDLKEVYEWCIGYYNRCCTELATVG